MKLERAAVGESCGGGATYLGDHNRAGLTVNAKLDKKKYQINVKVLAEEMASVNLDPHAFHGEWDYAIRPSH